MTICCSTGLRWQPRAQFLKICLPASIMSWWTSIKTPTAFKLRYCSDSSRKGTGLTVVGDDAQSIYSFRAATVRNILDFPGQFSPKAEIITLDRNYRSTKPILEAANAVIDLAGERFTKNLWSDRASSEQPFLVSVADDNGQCGYVVEKVLENREAGIALKAQAVLFRASNHSAMLEVELTRRNIPFVKFGGLKFLEAAHIKDILAVMRWAENPEGSGVGISSGANHAWHRAGCRRPSP